MVEFVAFAAMSLFFGYMGFLAFHGVVKIYQQRAEKPFYRLLGIISGIILGTMWAAVPVILIWNSPFGTIFGFVVIFSILKWIK